MFDKIVLDNLLPDIFSSLDPTEMQGDIWLNKVTFVKGQHYIIEAASGTGKTSLCSYIMGMRTDFTGTIYFDNENASKFTSKKWSEIRRVCLAWLPQEIGLFDNLTLWENIQIKNRLTRYLSDNQINEYIDRLGLTDKKNVKARLLSIGQQQRVGFIRMLAQPADFFLLDEPVSHLDAANNETMAQIMRETLQHTGASMIATSVGNRISIDGLKELKL